MIVIALIGQRKEQYEGQYAPEVIGAMNLIHYEDDPTFLQNAEKENHDAMAYMALVTVKIDQNELDRALNPKIPEITSTVQKIEVVKA